MLTALVRRPEGIICERGAQLPHNGIVGKYGTVVTEEVKSETELRQLKRTCGVSNRGQIVRYLWQKDFVSPLLLEVVEHLTEAAI